MTVDDRIEQAFMLGIQVASYLQGQRLTLETIQGTRVKIHDILRKIDAGELSFVDETPKVLGMAPPGMSEAIMKELPGKLDAARKKERTMARLLIREMYEVA